MVIMIVRGEYLFTVFEVLCALIAVWGAFTANVKICLVMLILFFFALFFIAPFVMNKSMIIKRKGKSITIETTSDYWG
jgi:hypothetical protein